MKLIMQTNHDKVISQCLMTLSFLGLSFIFMGGCYYKSLQSQQIIVTKNDEQNRLNNLANQVQNNLLEVSAEMQNFQFTHSQGLIIKLDAKISATKKNLIEIQKLVSSDEDKKIIENLESMVAHYQDDFYALTKAASELGVTEEKGLLKQFNKKIQDIETIVNNSKDAQLKEKFLLMQSFQKNYLSDEDSHTTAEQVIVAQKNFLDRVNRSAGDYTTVSKMMVQTISLMQTFDLVKISFEQKKNFSKKPANNELEFGLKHLADISYQYEKQLQELMTETEEQNFMLFLSSVILITFAFIISALMLTRSHTMDSIGSIEEDDFLQKANIEVEY